MDIVEIVGHIERYGRYLVIRLGLLYEVQFHMYPLGSHLAAGSGIVHVLRQEYRVVVAGAERLELLEYPEELRSNLREVKLGVYIYDGREHLLGNLVRDELVHAPRELVKIAFFEGKSRGIDMSAEVLE